MSSHLPGLRGGHENIVPHLREIKPAAVIRILGNNRDFGTLKRSSPRMTDDTASFELPKIMKVEDCETLHGFLASAQSKHIAFDCSSVERLSGLSAQMLVMAATVWRSQSLNVTFARPSDGFVQSVAILGLNDLLLPPQVAA